MPQHFYARPKIASLTWNVYSEYVHYCHVTHKEKMEVINVQSF